MPLPNPSPGLYKFPLKPPPESLVHRLNELSSSAFEQSKHHQSADNLRKTRVHRSNLPDRPWLKLENEQKTGSFKARGALNRLNQHSLIASDKGVITASTGNHGLAVAHAGRVYGNRVEVVHPCNISDAKLEKLRGFGVVTRAFGEDCVEAEVEARGFVERVGGVYVSPYNDIYVIAGQAGIGYEVLEQVGGVNSVYVTVGGGGLIAGIGGVVKPVGWRVVGCQPEKSAVMMRSVEAGEVVEVEGGETIADGSAGGIEQDCMTLPFCMGFVDAWIVVSEEEIREGMELLKKEGFEIEGAAGVAVAGYLRDNERVGEGVIVICGGNVSKR